MNARKLTVALAAAFALAGPSAALAQQKLKFAHVYETSEPYHTAAVWAAGEIAKRTSNRTAWTCSRLRRSATRRRSIRA